MNSLFALLGIDAWKPVVTALLLPPIPLLVLIFIGACYIPQRRLLGWLLMLLAVLSLWLSCCTGIGNLLIAEVLRPPQALSRDALGAIKAQVKARRKMTVVVVGGGRADYAPEYGVSSLTQHSLERLRYGLWLSREIGAPVGFAGGRGLSQAVGPPESEVAERIAKQEFRRRLDWTEEESSNTRQIARLTVVLLKRMGIKHAILVTHNWHMPRAMWLFTQAGGDSITFQAAPLTLSSQSLKSDVLDWLPTTDGYTKVRHALRELLARLAGA